MIKKLTFSAFLIGCTSLSLGKEINSNNQKIKRMQAEKITELSIINQKISGKEEAIDELTKKGSDIYYELLSSLEGDEKKKFDVDINAYDEKIFHSVFNLPEIKEFLAQEFFPDINKQRDLIRRIKFLLIRRKLEYISLNNLFDSYQKCLEELLELNDGIACL